MRRTRNIKGLFLLLALLSRVLLCGDIFVAPGGDDNNPGTEALPFRTIQKACDSAVANTNVVIAGGTYHERLTINHSGNATDGYITIQNQCSQSVVLDGTGIAAPAGSSAMISITSQSFVRIQGLEIANYQTAAVNSLVAGIYVSGSGSYIEIDQCHVHDIRNNAPVNGRKLGRDAHGIAFYGTSGVNSLDHVTLDGNTVDHCQLGSSEAVTLNGNVENFQITGNSVYDNDNIGIVMIGWEKTAPANDQTRNGIVRGNTVFNNNSSGNPAYGKDSSAGGLYVDGGMNIVLEKNTCYGNDIGIEIGCEHGGKTVSGCVVRDNVIYRNKVTGIAFGGYDLRRGTAINCQFLNNTCFQNDTSRSGTGEIEIQKGNGNTFKNNLVISNSQGIFVTNYFRPKASANNTFDHNLYFGPADSSAGVWVWNNKTRNGFAVYQKSTGQDGHSVFADPKISSGVDPIDLHLTSVSPAIDAGDPAFMAAPGETDFSGAVRISGSRVDLGAYEFQSASGGF